MKANICACNRCMTLYIDLNPQNGALEYDVPDNMPQLAYKEEVIPTVFDFGKSYLETEGYWVCPLCDTDEHLMDV